MPRKQNRKRVRAPKGSPLNAATLENDDRKWRKERWNENKGEQEKGGGSIKGNKKGKNNIRWRNKKKCKEER